MEKSEAIIIMMVYLAQINTDPCYEAKNKKNKKHILLGKFNENFENTEAVSFLNNNK